MTNQESVRLAARIRERFRRVCGAEINFSEEKAYNEEFWGYPWDWEPIEEVCAPSVANLLFHPEGKNENLPEIEEGRSRSYYDVFDGYYVSYYHSDMKEDDWRQGEAGKVGEGKLRDSGQEECMVASDDGILGSQMVTRIRKEIRIQPSNIKIKENGRFPDFGGGVAVHIDLLLDHLRMCVNEATGGKRELVLSKWGLREWYKKRYEGIGTFWEKISESEIEENVKRLFFTAEKQGFTTEEGEDMHIALKEAHLDNYLGYLSHIVPVLNQKEKGIKIRMTGWLARDAFREVIKQTHYEDRFGCEVTYDPTHQF